MKRYGVNRAVSAPSGSDLLCISSRQVAIPLNSIPIRGISTDFSRASNSITGYRKDTNMSNSALSTEHVEVAIQQEQVTIKALLAQIPTVALITPDDYEHAGSLSMQIATRMKTIEAERVEMKRPALELSRKIDTLFNLPLDALRSGKAAIDRLLLDYRNEQARKAREEQARLDALARKEEERLRKLAEAK